LVDKADARICREDLQPCVMKGNASAIDSLSQGIDVAANRRRVRKRFLGRLQSSACVGNCDDRIGRHQAIT
jgi:NADH:ubiquinone oxidoreductase subunit E